jgi:hypothetical protein
MELATGKELLTIDGLSTWSAVAFAPDGRTVGR